MTKLELTENQLKVISEACDILSRLYSGQIKELNKISHTQIPEHLLIGLKPFMFPELSTNSSYSISSSKINDNARVLYDIHQVIRYYLAWKDEKNSPKNRNWEKQIGVQFDDPINFSKEPLPKVKR